MAIKGSLLDRTKILPYWRTVCNYQTKTPSEPRDLSVAEPDYGGYWVGNGQIPRGVVHELIRWFSLQWKGIRSTWLGSGTPQSFSAVLETEKKPRFNWNLHVLFIFSSSPCRNSLKTDEGKKARKKHMWNVCSEIIDKENCVWNGEKTPKTQQNINATCRNKNHTRFVVCYCRAFLAMGYQNTTNIARRNKRFVANDFSCCSCANKSDRKRNNKNCLASAIPVFRFYFILFYLTYLTFHVCPIQGSSVMMFSQ